MVKEGSVRNKTKGSDIATRDYTIHMSKRLYGVTFKNRAPRAIAEIKKFATKAMGTKLVLFYYYYYYLYFLFFYFIFILFFLSLFLSFPLY